MLALVIVLSVALVALLGFIFKLWKTTQQVVDKLTEVQQEQEKEAVEESPIIDVSPHAVRKRIHQVGFDPDETAVVHIKTRKELEIERERKLDEELAHYQ